MTGLTLNQGDIIRIVTGTGAGWGNPLERSLSSLENDFQNNFVTQQQLYTVYAIPKSVVRFWLEKNNLQNKIEHTKDLLKIYMGALVKQKYIFQATRLDINLVNIQCSTDVNSDDLFENCHAKRLKELLEKIESLDADSDNDVQENVEANNSLMVSAELYTSTIKTVIQHEPTISQNSYLFLKESSPESTSGMSIQLRNI